MAPVVHGLEQQYKGSVDFLYLNVADTSNKAARERYGFVSTPQFFLVRPDGTPVESMQGVVPRDSLRRALDRLISDPNTR